MEFRDSITIAAPATVAGDIMKDVENWPSWTTTVTSAERSGTGDLAAGETVVVKQPKLSASTWTVTRADANGFEWRSESSPGIRNVGGHWATDNGDGTCTAELTLSFEGPLAFMARLFYSGLIRRYIRTEAEGLRRAAEAR